MMPLKKRARSSVKPGKLPEEAAGLLLKAVNGILAVPSTTGLFDEPVDIDAYPEYYEIVEKPMDFGTIRAMLEGTRSPAYDTPDEVLADIHLVWKNCMNFNDPGSDIVSICVANKTEAMKILRKHVGSMLKEYQALHMDDDHQDAVAESGTGAANVKAPEPQAVAALPAGAAKLARSLPTGKHKPFKSHPTFKALRKVLEDLIHMSYAEFFMNPVDEKLFQDYRKHVQNPMDITTVSKRLEMGAYNDDPTEFVKDLDLIYPNSVKYNGPKADITIQAKALQAVVDLSVIGHVGKNWR